MTDHAKVRAGKLAAVGVGVIAIVLGILFEKMNVTFLVGWAFSIAASANLPSLVMLLFWKGTTKQGITAAITVGMVVVARLDPAERRHVQRSSTACPTRRRSSPSASNHESSERPSAAFGGNQRRKKPRISRMTRIRRLEYFSVPSVSLWFPPLVPARRIEPQRHRGHRDQDQAHPPGVMFRRRQNSLRPCDRNGLSSA